MDVDLLVGAERALSSFLARNGTRGASDQDVELESGWAGVTSNEQMTATDAFFPF